MRNANAYPNSKPTALRALTPLAAAHDSFICPTQVYEACPFPSFKRSAETFWDAVNCSPTCVLQGIAWSHQTLSGFNICVQLGQDTGTLLWLNVRSTFSPLSVTIGLVQKPFWSYLAQLIKYQCSWGNYRVDWFNGQIVIMWDHQSKLIKEILLCPSSVSN